MTLNLLLAHLKSATAETPVVFIADSVKIGSGYHVTELKLARITSIDCGGRLAEWTEAAMQLLDGSKGEFMTSSKLAAILEQSVRQVKELGNAQAHIEFAPGNKGMRKYHMRPPKLKDGNLLIQMEESHAACKPAQEMQASCGPTKCCC